MKKSVKIGLVLLITLCVGVSGCGKKKTKTTEKKIKKTVTTTANEKTATKQMKKIRWVIELDPGHGGSDSGAEGISKEKLKEKDVNLKIAKYVNEELSKNPNIKVYMTRSEDTKPGLSERVSKAVEDKADLFISFHNNAKGEIVDYNHGCTVIVPTGNYNGKISEQAQILGCYFLKYLEKAGVTNQGLLMRTSEQKETYPNDALRDYYRVIHESIEKEIPGVIVEHSFIDNNNDVKQFLADDTKIKKLAKADAKAITDYCFGNVKQGKEVKQKVTLIKDSDGKNNQYSSKIFTLYECDKKTQKELRKKVNTKGVVKEIPYDTECKKYDFTGDGVKDSFRYKRNKYRDMNNIYLNHKKIQSIPTGKGSIFFYLCTDDNEKYLIEDLGAAGGNSLIVWKYRNKKFETVIGKEVFDRYTFSHLNIEKYKDGILSLSSFDTKEWNIHNFCGVFEARFNYQIKDDKLELLSPYFDVIHSKKCKAIKTFRTSKSEKDLNKKDGFEVKKGQKAKVKQVYLYDDDKENPKYAMKIRCGKKEGWFLDSEDIKFELVSKE